MMVDVTPVIFNLTLITGIWARVFLFFQFFNLRDEKS